MKRTTPDGSINSSVNDPPSARSMADTFLKTLVLTKELVRLYNDDSNKLIYLLGNRHTFEPDVFNHLLTILQTRITCILRIEPLINYYTQFNDELSKYSLASDSSGSVDPNEFLNVSPNRSIQFESNGSLLITTSTMDPIIQSSVIPLKVIETVPPENPTTNISTPVQITPSKDISKTTSKDISKTTSKDTSKATSKNSSTISAKTNSKTNSKITSTTTMTTTSTTTATTPSTANSTANSTIPSFDQWLTQTEAPTDNKSTEPPTVGFDIETERPPSPPPRKPFKLESPEDGEIVDSSKPTQFFKPTIPNSFPCGHLFKLDPSHESSVQSIMYRSILQHKKFGLNIRKVNGITYVGCPYKNCKFLHYTNCNKYNSVTNGKLWSEADEDAAYRMAREKGYRVISHPK